MASVAGLITLEYMGDSEGRMRYEGIQGRYYGDVDLNRYAQALPGDVVKLVETGDWRVVGDVVPIDILDEVAALIKAEATEEQILTWLETERRVKQPHTLLQLLELAATGLGGGGREDITQLITDVEGAVRTIGLIIAELLGISGSVKDKAQELALGVDDGKDLTRDMSFAAMNSLLESGQQAISRSLTTQVEERFAEEKATLVEPLNKEITAQSSQLYEQSETIAKLEKQLQVVATKTQANGDNLAMWPDALAESNSAWYGDNQAPEHVLQGHPTGVLWYHNKVIGSEGKYIDIVLLKPAKITRIELSFHSHYYALLLKVEGIDEQDEATELLRPEFVDRGLHILMLNNEEAFSRYRFTCLVGNRTDYVVFEKIKLFGEFL